MNQHTSQTTAGRSPSGSGSRPTDEAAKASSPEASIPNARFWTISQNNSGGIFDHDAEKGIGYAISVEAPDLAAATVRLQDIIDSYPASYDCPCCGDRWGIFLYEDDGAAAPSLYGESLAGRWGVPSYVHYLDGRIEERAEQVSA